ncbi:MAG TPA: response regulator [Pyrinomonadaceae bacterium]|nr:response regulator [Pyrinomonadaceae bacterium]
MDSPKLHALIEEAETRLAALRGWLLVGSQNGYLPADSDTPKRSILHLRSTAADSGFHEIAEVTGELAERLKTPFPENKPEAHREIRGLLDAVAKAESRIAEIRFDLEDSPIDVATFVERSFDILQIDPSLERDPQNDNFEIDSEMLEIFLTEAEDLVENIDKNLSSLRDDPHDSNALWEIRRTTHTFKGAAGIVGLRKPSELAHRIEDLLDHFINERGSRDQITQLLSDAIQCLRSLTTGENASGLSERIAKLYSDLDAVFAVSDGSKGTKCDGDSAASDHEESLHSTVDARQHILPGRQVIRISLDRLDELFRIVCDLVVSRSISEQRLSDFEMQIDDLRTKSRRLQSTTSEPVTNLPKLQNAVGDILSVNGSLYNVRDSLAMLFDHQRQLVEEMHQKLTRIRMVELGSIAGRLQRTVRTTCTEEGKLAEISIENEKLEIDTQILDHLIEPLMHLLKNAVVHGIEPPETRRLLGKPETGHIMLRAVDDETHIVFTIVDDGSGIAAPTLKEKAIAAGHLARAEADSLSESGLINLIFLPGITTAEKLTLNAGRGVGMNIVKESVESRQGTLTIDSTPQVGTTFTIKMPLPMAVSKVLIVTASGSRFAIPMRTIKHVAEAAALDHNSDMTTTFGGKNYELVSLDSLLSSNVGSNPIALFIEEGSTRFALAVESVLWTEEILFKPLGKTNGNTDLLGEAILGNNLIVPIPDLEYLVKNRQIKAPVVEPKNARSADVMVLIVDDSPSVRYMASKLIEALGLIVETATDGADALKKMSLTKQKPALIISDVEMPKIDGFEFLAAIKNDSDLRDIPVVMLTSRAGEESRQRALDAGAADYILKPFDDAKLIEIVEGFIPVSA